MEVKAAKGRLGKMLSRYSQYDSLATRRKLYIPLGAGTVSILLPRAQMFGQRERPYTLVKIEQARVRQGPDEEGAL